MPTLIPQGKGDGGGPGTNRAGVVKKPELFQQYKPLYPEGLDLSPGETKHEELVSEILLRARDAERALKNRHGVWDEIDRSLRAFIPLDSTEKDLQADDGRKPVSIVIPESYATLETLVTYNSTVFGTTPMFSLAGTGPEDQVGATLLEILMDIQSQRAKHLLPLMQSWRDSYSYGFGVTAVSWAVRTGKRSINRPIVELDLNGEPFVAGNERVDEDVTIFEGNELDAIDPRRYLPDPRPAIYEPQKGEYVGWVVRDQYMNLRRMEAEPGSQFFNVKYIEDLRGHRSNIYFQVAREREAEGSSFDRRPFSPLTFPVDVIPMYVDLIPRDWGLSDKKEPEKWLFALANDQVIIMAHPMDLNHNLFPVAVCAPDAGGHEVTPTSRMEIMSGLQKVTNFFINSRVREVDRFHRNTFIVDPKSVNMEDVRVNQGIFRTKPSMWGRGVKDVMAQLPMQDVTASHPADIQFLQQLSRNTTGVVDSLLGVQRQGGERVTATEFSQTRGSAVSRLQKGARMTSLQQMQPLGEMQAFHIQQLMSEDTYVKITGRWEADLRAQRDIPDFPFMRVTPFDIAVNFDVAFHDGSVLGGEDAEQWIRWLTIASQSEQMLAEINIPRVLLHIARLMGNNAPEDFLIKRTEEGPQQVQTTVLPDEEVAEQEQAGNLVGVQ